MNELVHIFSKKKIINIPFLNRIGLQVFRLLAAQARYKLRPKASVKSEFANDVNFFDLNGALIKQNFLETKFFEDVKAEARKALAEDTHLGKVRYFGSNKKILINILDIDKNKYPALYTLLGSEYITQLFKSATRKKISFLQKENTAIAQIEYLLQGDDKIEDIETQIHTDIFYHSFKAWLYLNDITPEHGPLTYFMRSRNNDKIKLKYEYINSIKQRPDVSRRVTQDELKERDLKETVMEVKENTFVMADIHGYHRRLKGVQGKERLAIIFRERGNPFFN